MGFISAALGLCQIIEINLPFLSIDCILSSMSSFSPSSSLSPSSFPQFHLCHTFPHVPKGLRNNSNAPLPSSLLVRRKRRSCFLYSMSVRLPLLLVCHVGDIFNLRTFFLRFVFLCTASHHTKQCWNVNLYVGGCLLSAKWFFRQRSTSGEQFHRRGQRNVWQNIIIF